MTTIDALVREIVREELVRHGVIPERPAPAQPFGGAEPAWLEARFASHAAACEEVTVAGLVAAVVGEQRATHEELSRAGAWLAANGWVKGSRRRMYGTGRVWTWRRA